MSEAQRKVKNLRFEGFDLLYKLASLKIYFDLDNAQPDIVILI